MIGKNRPGMLCGRAEDFLLFGLSTIAAGGYTSLQIFWGNDRMLLSNDVSRTRGKKGRRGFTLIEIMMVIVIIALLTGLILGIAGHASRQGDRKKAIGDMEKIKAALEEYRLARNTYYNPDPSKSPPLTIDTSDGGFTGGLKSYAASNINYTDPWGRPFVYTFASKLSFSLRSKGPDGADGNEDDVDLAKGNM